MGYTMGRRGNSESQRTQTQLPPSKASLQLCFQAQESSEMHLGTPCPLPWRLGSTAPRLTLLWAQGAGARGVPATARLFPSSYPGFSLAQSASATGPANPHSSARPSAGSQPTWGRVCSSGRAPGADLHCSPCL